MKLHPGTSNGFLSLLAQRTHCRLLRSTFMAGLLIGIALNPLTVQASQQQTLSHTSQPAAVVYRVQSAALAHNLGDTILADEEPLPTDRNLPGNSDGDFGPKNPGDGECPIPPGDGDKSAPSAKVVQQYSWLGKAFENQGWAPLTGRGCGG